MKSILYFFILLSNIFCQSGNQDQINEKEWIGSYSFSARNREGLKTSFDIEMIKLDNITVKYISDGGKVQTYKNIKGKLIQKNKLSIPFNPQNKEMGLIYVEKTNKEFFISGSPIYFINPGNDVRPLKKINY